MFAQELFVSNTQFFHRPLFIFLSLYIIESVSFVTLDFSDQFLNL